MTTDQVRTPVGVVIAAVVLGIMAFVGLFIAACSAFVLYVSHNPIIPRIPQVRLAVGGLDALLLALVVLSACTIFGLFRLKLWARYSMTLLGLLDFVTFGLMVAGILVGRAKWDMAAMPIPGHPGLMLGDIMLALAAFYAVLALIGIWWMVYFNLRPVRIAFADPEQRLTP